MLFLSPAKKNREGRYLHYFFPYSGLLCCVVGATQSSMHVVGFHCVKTLRSPLDDAFGVVLRRRNFVSLTLSTSLLFIKTNVKLNTSIITGSKFLLSPFPPSNVGIGTATDWPIAGVPSSYLQVSEQNSNLDVSS